MRSDRLYSHNNERSNGCDRIGYIVIIMKGQMDAIGYIAIIMKGQMDAIG
jgi:hypothetical protein